MDLLLSIGPTVVLVAWFLGQWDAAGPEPRAWLLFTTVLALASLTPLPGRASSRTALVAQMKWWGWMIVAGLLVAS